MLSQRFQEFTSFQSQYYRMAWLPPLQASATPSELMTQQTQLCFILRIHQCRECEESEETCLLSQFPAHTSSAVVSHNSFLSSAWLSDSGRVFCISVALCLSSGCSAVYHYSLLPTRSEYWEYWMRVFGGWWWQVAGKEWNCGNIGKTWPDSERGLGAAQRPELRPVNDRGKDGSGHLSPGRF